MLPSWLLTFNFIYLEPSISHSGFDSLAWPSSRSWRFRARLVLLGLLGSCCPHCQFLSQPSGRGSWLSLSPRQPRVGFGRVRQISAACEGCLCTASLLGTCWPGTRSMWSTATEFKAFQVEIQHFAVQHLLGLEVLCSLFLLPCRLQ